MQPDERDAVQKMYDDLMEARETAHTDGEGPEDVQFIVEVDYGEDGE